MKSINLMSFVQAFTELTTEVFQKYMFNFGISLKAGESEDLIVFTEKLLSFEKVGRTGVFSNYFLGYSIPQISKEFDLLRFGRDEIINIELKRKSTADRIKKQLIQNRYYLGFLNKKILNFTYVVEEDKLYTLDDNLIYEVDIEHLLKLLQEQDSLYIKDLDSLFNPSDYLVSPFNSTDLFVEDKYFLTDQQEEFKRDIKKNDKSNGPLFFSVTGAPGTGKTLLTYDLAKYYRQNNNKVLIIHCGTLNNGHTQLVNNYNWEIIPIKFLEHCDLSDYDVIIIDETQRIRKNQLNKIIDEVNKLNKICIFSFDGFQCLSVKEIRRNIPGYIEEVLSPKTYKLSEKVRSNKEIASFVKNLFNTNNKNRIQVYNNISVQYFSEQDEVKRYLHLMGFEGWKVINYTPSQYGDLSYTKYQPYHNDTAHRVIGQEYDNVVAVIDDSFYYDQIGNLSVSGYYSAPYDPVRMLFQIVTRARNNLQIVILNNESLLKECLKILQKN